MIPVARTEKLVVREVNGDLLVYDQENHTSHCLKRIMVKVWELCNGRNAVNDIANHLENELNIPNDQEVDMRGLVWLMLEQLEYFHLIKEYKKQPINTNAICYSGVCIA